MDILPYLGEPKTLSKWITECIDNPGQQFWLLFRDLEAEEDVRLSTIMYPILDDGDLSDEEYEEFESSINEGGYSNFLNLDQIEDVISNLSMQVNSFTQEELLDAINFYFNRDAFLVVGNG